MDTFSVTDTLAVLAEDSATVVMTDASLWSGSADLEHGQVYPDSLTIGQRDNPSRRIW